MSNNPPQLSIEVAPAHRMGELLSVSSRFIASSRLVIDGTDPGPEEPISMPYEKDYDAFPGDGLATWPQQFQVATWGLLLLKDASGNIAGGSVIAAHEKSVDLLEGREDLAHVFDFRVAEGFRHQRYGRMLWEATCKWCLDNGVAELRVETQDVNVAACRFYQAMGCTVAKVNHHAYPQEMHESQVIWSLNLVKACQQAATS